MSYADRPDAPRRVGRTCIPSTIHAIIRLIVVPIIIATGLLASCLSSPPPTHDETTNSSISPSPGVHTFREVARAIIPSVVEIRVSPRRDTVTSGEVSPFEHYFDQGDDSATPSPGIGSGIIVRIEEETGFVVTNRHVITEGGDVSVITHDGLLLTGTVVGIDQRRDLAVISFPVPENVTLSVARLGDSDTLQLGDWVLAVGNPFGFSSTLTAGIVSALGRHGPPENISDFIQTDAAINQGNSGGPLVSLSGEVVGINTWISAPGGGNVGLGFAIPINNAKRAIIDLIEFGAVEYGWLGVEVEEVELTTAAYLDYQSVSGALVTQVYAGSPAIQADIRAGDIVVTIDGIEVRDFLHLVRLIGDTPPGSTVACSVYRNGVVLDRTVSIGVRLSDSEIEIANRTLWPGMRVSPLSDEASVNPDGNGILIEELKAQAPPQAAGLREGDIILSVNGVATENLLDFYRVVNDKDMRTFDFSIMRRGEKLSFAVHRSTRK